MAMSHESTLASTDCIRHLAQNEEPVTWLDKRQKRDLTAEFDQLIRSVSDSGRID